MPTEPCNGWAGSAIPVAEYVRMSTDKQDMSVINQRAIIAEYADAHNMIVVQRYADEGRSGIDVEGRPALQRLLRDVQNHCADFKAILVLDVSRWGRFQNVDEAAFYEFLCTQHGIRVIYVAEPFVANEGPFQSILKSLKRSMAAEYSRELSAKVFAGQARLARAGFAMGGRAAYGLQRMLVDSTGKPRCILKKGERKSIATDRIRLVLGPPHEVSAVRWMFKQSAAGVGVKKIAEQLNKRGKRNAAGQPWSANTIQDMLNDLRYTGTMIFGRPNSRARIKPDPHEQERKPIRVEHAFPAIVTQELYRAAQTQRRLRNQKLTDNELLEALRDLWRRKGRITTKLLNCDAKVRGANAYIKRFGSLRAVYKLVDYVQDRNLDYGNVRDHMQVWLASVVGCVREALEDNGSSVTQNGRSLLSIDETWSVSFHLMQSSRDHRGKHRWFVPRFHSTADILVGIRMDAQGDRPLDYLILPTTSTKMWPHIVQVKPKPKARFYLFASLQVLRELAAFSTSTLAITDDDGSQRIRKRELVAFFDMYCFICAQQRRESADTNLDLQLDPIYEDLFEGEAFRLCSATKRLLEESAKVKGTRVLMLVVMRRLLLQIL
ncbi:MAG TPA: recombinase family protein, partial [Dyella sp.]|nr:recombinase family protein [Dyella sp.]